MSYLTSIGAVYFETKQPTLFCALFDIPEENIY